MKKIIKGVSLEAPLFGGLYASLYAGNHTLSCYCLLPRKSNSTLSVKIVWY